MKQLLLIEDDQVFAQVLQKSMLRKSVEVTHVATIDEIASVQAIDFDYLVIDLFLENESGLDALETLRKQYPEASILILTGYASIATTVQAIKAGADNYLPKPANATQILQALEQGNQNEAFPEQNPVEQSAFSADRMQWEYIQRALAENNGNISATARELGMHRRTLQRKLQKKPKAH